MGTGATGVQICQDQPGILCTASDQLCCDMQDGDDVSAFVRILQ